MTSSVYNNYLSACKTGIKLVIQDLIKTQPASVFKSEINRICDRNRMYGTHLAAESGNADILELLLHSGADIFKKTCRGNTPLHIAARSNQLECTKVLLRFANDMWTKVRLLWIACYKPTEDSLMSKLPQDVLRLIAKILMRDSVSFNKLILNVNNENLTAFEYALKNNARKIIPLLVTPATVMQISGYLGSPLHYSAHAGSVEATVLLVKLGCNVNARNSRGETPLFRACCSYPEATETVKTLLELGADASVVASNGKTAEDEARARRYGMSVTLLEDHNYDFPLY